MKLLTSLREEYRATLKAVEMEEPLDLYFYRPLAYVVAKALARTRATPNQVSVASLIFGVGSGALIWTGQPAAYVLAAVAYFLCNVLDCADGQLARMKKTSSPIGYIVDGSIDYFATFAVFGGITHALVITHPLGDAWWLIGLLAIGSMGWQTAFLDRKRHEWMNRVYDRRADWAKEIAEFRAQAEAWRLEGGNYAGRALIALYLFHRASWAKFFPSSTSEAQEMTSDERARWAERHRPVLRAATLMGSSMQMTCIMAAALARRLDLYFYATLSVGTAWALVVSYLQRQATSAPAGQALKVH